MGPWDVMSAHFVDRKGPPPGLSSFSKIRLGWISTDQVIQVRPAETEEITLGPLAVKGEVLAAKIPLSGDQYYLVENRQPIKYDKVLPDSGILVIKVDPNAVEGTGTARIMDADPKSPNFRNATYRPDRKNRKRFVDNGNGVAIVALSAKGNEQRILITTPERAMKY